MSTLLEYLSVVDPSLDRTNAKKGTNSFNRDWEDLEGVEEWMDFTYENLIAMLGNVLTQPYQQHEFDSPAPVRRSACCIVNEPTVTAVLLKWNHTIVDCALELASKASSTIPAISWTLGNHSSLRGETVLPDWAGVYSNMGFPPSNRVPGDTKVSGKWNTDQQHDHSKQEEFYKPLRQVVHYARLFNTRYAYIISDKELVCIRRTLSEYEGVSLAADRPARTSQPPATPIRQFNRLSQEPTTPSPRTDSSPPFRVVIPHPQSQQRDERYLTPEHRTRVRQNSIVSITALSNMSLDSPSLLLSSPSNIRSSPSAYTADGNFDVNEGNVQIAVIPWGENRSKHLTINLALFWLHILAGCDITLQSSYPSLGKELNGRKF
ncbi:hypothetical protein I7I50_04640 [Histoplasma capsulatum G186AR]|uniref:Uncharacterized protein n=1 Tax=Ajellomyces capsulatus TaxID=5037 RepID=A0A8H7YKG9_AJECA|nr:hypothetical protein I7I52_05549 [Histoplasma capsulatum]QSS75492.1 hypothetical protein I7I50_04640 [Histoplasma capsulatum G186AR]